MKGQARRPPSTPAHEQTSANVDSDVPATQILAVQPIQEKQPSPDAAKPGLVAQPLPPPQYNMYNAVVAVGATTPNKSPTTMPSTQMVRETDDSLTPGAATKIEPEAHTAPPPCNRATGLGIS